MQLKFETDYLYLLFTDPYFQDKALGIKTIKAYRLIVNYLAAAQTVNDLHKACFLNLSQCNDGSGCYSIAVEHKHQLIISIRTEEIVLHRLSPHQSRKNEYSNFTSPTDTCWPSLES